MRILGDGAHFLEFLNFSVTKFSLGTLRSHKIPLIEEGDGWLVMPKTRTDRVNFTSKNMFEMVFISKLYAITLIVSCIKSYLALLRDLSIFLKRVLTPT